MRSTLSLLLFAFGLSAQNQELGLTLGRIGGATRTSPGGDVELNSGMAMQANYGYRFLTTPLVGLSAEVHFIANGQRTVDSVVRAATRDIATLYFTPGLRVKFTPRSRFQPYAVIGGGYSLYEQSFFRIDGTSNGAPRFRHGKTLMYGGGVDIPLWRFLGARFETRDFFSGNPAYNVSVSGDRQHNVVAAGGFTLRWGRN